MAQIRGTREPSMDALSPWEKEIVLLAEARAKVNGESEAISQAQKRAIRLCKMVEDLAWAEHSSEASWNALAEVMSDAQENVWIAWWLCVGRPLDSHWE